MRFFVGLHHPADSRHFDRCMVSVNVLRNRKSDIRPYDWMLDSGAFTTVTKLGGYPHGPEEYAEQVRRWGRCGNLLAATAQDWMCEPFALKATGLTIPDHQALTVERYVALRALVPDTYILPVLQGWHPTDYVRHVRDYGSLLKLGAWVGVGSVCKRNSSVAAIEDVLAAIHTERPDLRLHGFGLKLTALTSDHVRTLLYSADSMAWSYAARYERRNGNDWREAERFVRRVEGQSPQLSLLKIGEAA